MTTRPIAILTVGNQSDIGKERDQNQDSLMCFMPVTAAGVPPQQGWLFVVADGMGGYAAGEVASQIAVETIVQHYAASDAEDLATVLQQGISLANEAVCRRGQELGVEIMGTTVVCAAVRDDQLYIAHVGDSRAYLLRGETLKALTRDHSLVSEQVRQGLLTEAEALESDLRGIVTRALGMKSRVEADIAGPLDLHADDVILLCSDGVCGYVPEDQIRYILQTHRAAPQAAAELLVEAANAAGGFDNATAVVLSVSRIEQVALEDDDTNATAPHATLPQPASNGQTQPASAGRSNTETMPIAATEGDGLEQTSDRLAVSTEPHNASAMIATTLARLPAWARTPLAAGIAIILALGILFGLLLAFSRGNAAPLASVDATPTIPVSATAPSQTPATQAINDAEMVEYTLTIAPQAPLITLTHLSAITIRAQAGATTNLTVTFRTNATIIEPTTFDMLIDLSQPNRAVRVELAPQVNFNRQEQVKIEALAEQDAGADRTADNRNDWTIGTFGLPPSPGLRMRARLTALIALEPAAPARPGRLPVRLFIRWLGTGAIPGDFKPEVSQTQR
ncbi:MAG: PP2C family protein-serine/threonine phosphatase [Anaerolineae bacterium]